MFWVGFILGGLFGAVFALGWVMLRVIDKAEQ